MAHFARVRDGRVQNVIVAEQDFIDFISKSETEPGVWIQCSYNTKGGVHLNGGKPTSHWGSVTTNERGNRPPTMRLFWDQEVLDWLKEVYSLTHQRLQIRRKLDWNGPTAEKKMPFWEFIDIEYDDEECTFHFTAHFNLGHQSGLLLLD